MLVFFMGCTVSILTSRALTLRLVVASMAAWVFVPLIEIGALALVCAKDRQGIPFNGLIDAFFKGYRPWLLWLTGLCVIWSVLSPASQSIDFTVSIVWLNIGAVFAVLWSLHIDFGFFRSVLQRSPRRAARELVVHRLVSWGLILAVVGAPTIWSEITGRLW
jgi:hypothetical protein